MPVASTGAARTAARRSTRAAQVLAARCARPTAGTGRGRRGSRASAPTETGSSIALYSSSNDDARPCRARCGRPARSARAPADGAPVDRARRSSSRGRATVQPPPRRGGSPRAGARRWRRRARRRTRGCGRCVAPPAPTHEPLAARRRAARARRAPARRSLQRLLQRLGGAVDHRVAGVGLAQRRRPSAPARRCDHAAPGCRTRRARSRSSVRNSISGPRHQREALAPRVLEQVAPSSSTSSRSTPRSARGPRGERHTAYSFGT